MKSRLVCLATIAAFTFGCRITPGETQGYKYEPVKLVLIGRTSGSPECVLRARRALASKNIENTMGGSIQYDIEVDSTKVKEAEETLKRALASPCRFIPIK
jgi:hypothetical protein